jgi:ATP-dependent Clp protease ATP-binding subunit ClpC
MLSRISEACSSDSFTRVDCIGETALNEYRQFIEKDGALERGFQKIMVDPTSAEETLEILNQIKGKYEKPHSVNYTAEAFDACVKLINAEFRPSS